MENNDRLAEHRSRSLQAVLGDGYRLYLRQFPRLLRSSWIQAIIYALVTGGSMTFFFGVLLPLQHCGLATSKEWLLWGASVVAFVIAAIMLAFAGAFAPLRQHWQTGTISSPLRFWGCWPWRLTLHGLCRLPRMLFDVFRKRQAGILVTVLLVTLLAVLVATVLLQLPAIIMATANVEAAAGLSAGDAVDVPENLLTLDFIVFALCGLLQGYIHMSMLYPLYYVWRNAADAAPQSLTTPDNP